jgi:hypothetical protein
LSSKLGRINSVFSLFQLEKRLANRSLSSTDEVVSVALPRVAHAPRLLTSSSCSSALDLGSLPTSHDRMFLVSFSLGYRKWL